MPNSYNEAQSALLRVAADHSRSFTEDVQDVTIGDAVGRINNADIVSPISTPAFDTSAMDGYALSSQETWHASPSNPILFRVKGTMAAGDRPIAVSDNFRGVCAPCTEIMTGAQFPKPTEGQPFDACVRIEDTAPAISNGEDSRSYIQIMAPVRKDKNRRYAGNDIQRGDVIVAKGAAVAASHVMALASLGISQIPVRRKPRVGLWSTGSELVPHDAGGSHEDHITNSNGPYVAASLRSCGVEVDELGILQDSVEDLIRALKKRLLLGKYDLLITTGAVSVGKFDMVPEGLRRLGAVVQFHRVAMRPGAPIMFATLPSGHPMTNIHGNFHGPHASSHHEVMTAFFGLPGNPMATAIGLRFFVMPYLRRLTGQGLETPMYAAVVQPPNCLDSNGTSSATLPFNKSAKLDVFRHGQLVYTMRGPEVVMREDQGASKVGPWLRSNVWVHLPSGLDVVQPGDMLPCYQLNP